MRGVVVGGGPTLRFGRVETDTPLLDSVSEFTYQTVYGAVRGMQSDQAPVRGIFSAGHVFHVAFSLQNVVKW